MEIEYYTNNRGDCEILNFISKLRDQKHKKAIIDTINDLQNNDFNILVKINEVEKICKNPPIYELKCHYGKNIYRILFGIRDDAYQLLLIFNKKDQKVRKKYIDLAIERLNNLS